jgi:hypothetical protein
VSDILTVLKLTPERLCELFAERGATVTPDMLSRWAEMGVPTTPSARLSRRLTAETLSIVGYPTTQSTLNTLATTGDGPLFDRYGGYAIYEWGDAISWAQSKSSGKRRSSSEGRSQEAAELAWKSAKHARDVRDQMRREGRPMGQAAKAKAATPAKPKTSKPAKQVNRRLKTRPEAAPSAPAEWSSD